MPEALRVGQDWLAVRFVAVAAVAGATTMALVYWALGAKRTTVRVAWIIVALGVP